MTTTVKWLDEVTEAERNLQDVVIELQDLAGAFYLTGNRAMGEKLLMLAGNIEDSRNRSSSAISQMLAEQVRAGFNQFNSVFTVALDSVSGTQE